ncbi:MAG: sensor domain-containing diguanylate cyclase, partial [Anaerolineae bacterium]|nr:sensor domain-containing diguanylate cyclase [Anaerolineae bacterium]
TPGKSSILKTTRKSFNGPILYFIDKQDEEKLQSNPIVGPFCFRAPAVNVNSIRSSIKIALYKFHHPNPKNDESYQIISEMVTDSSFSIKLDDDGNTTLEWVNDNFENLTGYTFEDFMRDDRWKTHIHPDDQQNLESMIENLLRGQSVNNEYRLRHHAGHLIWIQFLGQPYFNGTSKRVEKIYCALRNITKIKLTKEILYQDQEELRALFDNAPIGMAITSLDHRLISVNTTFCTMTGYSYRDLISMPIIDITHPADRDAELEHFKGLNAGVYISFEMEKRLLTHEGKELLVNMHASLIRDTHSIPSYYISQYVDITQRRADEKLLEESFMTFSTVLNSLDAYVNVIDPQTHEILFANQHTIEAFGQVTGKPCWQVLPDHQNSICAYCNQHSLNTPEEKTRDFVIEEDFYSKINAWVEIRAHTVRWIDNRLVRLEIATDITRRKRMEVEMQLLNGSLSANLLAMQEHNRQITLLNRMNKNLQACHNTQEAYPLIQQTCQDLFHDHPGVLLIRPLDKDDFEIACQWGTPIHPIDNSFIKDCPIFVDKKPILALFSDSTTTCPHLKTDKNAPPFICIPLIHEDNVFGVLHIEYYDTNPFESIESLSIKSSEWKQLSIKEWEDLALLTAPQISLSLVNLSLKEQLQLEAIRDPLTGLYNRRYMQESLEREFNRALRHNHPVSVMMMDIDHFKTYNDRYGHMV